MTMIHRRDFSLVQFARLAVLTTILCAHATNAFLAQNPPAATRFQLVTYRSGGQQRHLKSSSSSSSSNSSSSNKNNEGGEERFSREVRLREEAESPFRKVRYFLYLNLAGGALTSFLISSARIAAALSGVNTDLMDESVRNAAIDAAGLVAVAYFYNRDRVAEESRLKRATRGAELARLPVRASKRLLEAAGEEEQRGAGTFTTTLASFRRQRGIEKRVVIAAAGADTIRRVLREAKELQSDLASNDLIVVPVVLPRGVAPTLAEGEDLESTLTNVALPVTAAMGGGNSAWSVLLEEEASEAISQGVNIEEEGFCVVLKKNGRVGQRTRGIFLNNLVGNVVARKEAGMDVKNI
jgi:Low psii accumulation1 / Rep27